MGDAAVDFLNLLRRGGLAAGALAIAGYVVWGQPEKWVARSSAAGMIYFGSERYLFAAAVAFLLLLSLTEHPLGKRLARVLSFRGFHPIARLAYVAYLVNPLCIGAVYALRTPILSPSAFGLFLAADLTLTFLVAALLHVFWESPFMRLRGASPRAAVGAARESASPFADRDGCRRLDPRW